MARFLVPLIVLFVVVGCSKSAPPAPVAAVSSGEAAQLFASDCAPCHGANGHGTGAGVSLLATKSLSDEAVAGVIRNGKGSMPAWGGRLSDGQIKALAGYVRGLR